MPVFGMYYTEMNEIETVCAECKSSVIEMHVTQKETYRICDNSECNETVNVVVSIYDRKKTPATIRKFNILIRMEKVAS